MTPLERALTVAARRDGKTWDYIAEALHRDPSTLKRAINGKRFLAANAQTLRKVQMPSATQ